MPLPVPAWDPRWKTSQGEKQNTIWIKVCEASQTHQARAIRKQWVRRWQPTSNETTGSAARRTSAVILYLPDFSFLVHRIFQARILEWTAIPFSRGSSRPRNWTRVSCIASRFFTIWTTRERVKPTWLEVKIQWKIMKLSLFFDARFPFCTSMFAVS